MSIDEKKLKEIQNRVKEYISREVVKSRQKPHDTDFFLKNSENSINSARALFDLSTDEEMQKKAGYEGLNGFLWVINASYYSMFYMVRALLEKSGIKLRMDLSVHMITFDAFVYYFFMNKKLEKSLLEYYADAKADASELLGAQKAEELVEDYFFEKGKRAKFTYQTGELAMKNRALTSLDRAARFNREIRRMVE